MQAGGHHGPGCCRTQDRIAVIQQGIDIGKILIAAKIAAHHQRPIDTSSLRLGISAIAGLDISGEHFQRRWGLANSGQSCRLQLYFGDDDLLPSLFDQRLRRVPLCAHPRILHMMAIERAEHRPGLVIWTAKDNRRAAISQFNKQGIAPGDSVGMGNHSRDLIERHAADGLARRLDFHESAILGEMAAFLADIDNLIQSRGSSTGGS